jgi:acetate kinase
MPGEAIETIMGRTVLEGKFGETRKGDPDGSLTQTLLTALHEGGFERLVADLILVSQRLEREASGRRLDLRHIV